MATVAELKQFLEQFDDDTHVDVVVQNDPRDGASEADLELDDAGEWEYIECKRPGSHKTNKYLTLGKIN